MNRSWKDWDFYIERTGYRNNWINSTMESATCVDDWKRALKLRRSSKTSAMTRGCAIESGTGSFFSRHDAPPSRQGFP